MASRVVVPDDDRLPLSRGDWLIVKKRLNSGENKAMLKRGIGTDGNLNAIDAGTAKVLAYLLDWSLTAPDGKPLVIRDQSPRAVEEAIDAIDPESYTEVLRAIEAHEEKMRVEREAEKNAQAGETIDAGISPLPSVPAAT